MIGLGNVFIDINEINQAQMNSRESDLETLLTITDESEKVFPFKGAFSVISYPTTYKEGAWVSEELCTISPFCPQLNLDPNKTPLRHIPFSLVKEAMEGKPIEIDWHDRKFILEFEEEGGISKQKLLSFANKKVEILENSDVKWILESSYFLK